MADNQKVRVLVEIDKSDLERVFGEEYAIPSTFAGYVLNKIARSISHELSTSNVVVGYVAESTGRSVRFDSDGRIDVGELAEELVGALR